jgi:16S rRNA (guanine(966)-N(2))-methyltransferase RsmD
LFNSLGPRIEEAHVLDLYAGTGALGLEALRRGAASALFVEHTVALAADLRRRLAVAGWADRAEVWRRDALAAIRDLAGSQRSFDVILLDPPYGRGLVAATLQAIAGTGLLRPDGVVAAEGHWRDRPGEIASLRGRREAKYGETMLWYFERLGGDRP